MENRLTPAGTCFSAVGLIPRNAAVNEKEFDALIAELITIRRVEVLGRLDERILVSYCRNENDLHKGPIQRKKSFCSVWWFAPLV